jgi:transposase
MIAASAGVKVMVSTKPVDFRKGADGLAALVHEQLRHDPFSGTIFVFRSKRADRLKILAWNQADLRMPQRPANQIEWLMWTTSQISFRPISTRCRRW